MSAHGMEEGATIVSLASRPDLLDACARLAADEWAGATGYDQAAWREELRDLLADGSVVLIALGAMRRGNLGRVLSALTPRRHADSQVLGMVTLIAQETPPDVRGLGPWVSALLVRPDGRKSGLGRRLLGAACDTARGQGAEAVYALTEIPEWFARLGWQAEGTTAARGVAVSIMSRKV